MKLSTSKITIQSSNAVSHFEIPDNFTELLKNSISDYYQFLASNVKLFNITDKDKEIIDLKEEIEKLKEKLEIKEHINKSLEIQLIKIKSKS